MGEAIEAPIGLAGLVGCYMAIGFFAILSFTLVRLIQTVDIDLPVIGHPFHGIAKRAENAVTDGCNVAIRELEGWATFFENMLIEAFGLLIAIPILGYEGTRAALHYLWDKALIPRIHSITDHIEKDATTALARAGTVERDLSRGIDRLEHELHTGISAGIAESERFAIDSAKTLERDFSKGIDTLSKNFEQALERARTGIESEVGTVVDKLRSAEDKAIEAADALEGATAQDLRDLIGRIPLTDIAALIAAVPLLRALIKTLEAETGLDNPECRQKIKQICSTNPNAWKDALALLVDVGALMDWRQLVNFADDIGTELVAPFVGYVDEQIKDFTGI